MVAENAFGRFTLDDEEDAKKQETKKDSKNENKDKDIHDFIRSDPLELRLGSKLLSKRKSKSGVDLGDFKKRSWEKDIKKK